MSTRTTRSSTRKFAAAMAVALVASLLALTTPVAAKQSVSTTRISGTDRFATSVALSTAASVAGANNTHFVLVNGSSFADALSAAALAGAKQGTIISLPADGTISASATARMASATNITIIGGFKALPSTVETTMRTLRATATITRISGGDRYATAANVASNIVNTVANGALAAVNGKKSVFLADGASFADAVIAAPGAYAGPNNSADEAVVPIMLTNTDKLSEATKAQLVVLGVKQVFVLGGIAAVSAATAAEVAALGITVVRLSGANRYGTAVAIADKFTALTTAGGWGFDDDDIALVNIEESGGGADALAAAPYLGKSKAVALGAGSGALATETSTWLTAHNGATGVAKIHAIGGTVAVTAAQLTSADAAGTISGPVATVTAVNGSSTVTVAFSQTVSKTSAELSTGYSIFGPGTPPTITTVAYSAAKNTVTLSLNGPLQTTDVVRVNAGIVTTASGSLTVGRTDTTVGADSSIPTCSIYAATGTATITVTCSELVVQNGTLDTDVDSKVTVGGVAVASTANEAAGGSKVITITRDAGTWSGTGAAIVIQKDLFKDLGGNKVAQLTGTMVTDTGKPTVVGLPTYTIAGKAIAELEVGGTETVKELTGVGTPCVVSFTLTNTTLTFTCKSGLTTTGTNYSVAIGTNAGTTACSLGGTTLTIILKEADNAGTNATALNNVAACGDLGTFVAGTTGGAITNADDDKTAVASTVGVDTDLILTAVEANVFQNVQTIAVTDSSGAETCTGTDTAISIGLDITAASQTVAEAIAAFNADADCNRYFTMSSADTGTEQIDTTAVSAGTFNTTTGSNDAITVRSKTAGVGGNAYKVQVADNNAALAIGYTSGTKTILISHDVDSSAVAAATPAAIKAAMDAHATVKTLVLVAVSTNSVTMPVQAATALVGGTSTLTVTTTFSEAVTVDAVTDIKYNADGTDGDEVSYATVSGSGTTSVKTTYTLDGTTHQVAPTANTSEMLYAAAIPDLATNTLTSVTPLLSAP